MNMKLARQLCQLLFGEIRTFIFWKYILQFLSTYSKKYTYLLGYLGILVRPSISKFAPRVLSKAPFSNKREDPGSKVVPCEL